MCHARCWVAICLMLGMLLPGCSSTPKPVNVRAVVEAQKNVNPDSKGRASPVIVRVYELKSLAAFNDLDFFSLYERDKETLGAEMLAREELQLKPGESRLIERPLQLDTRYVGVVAAFRDLARAQWRAAVAIPAERKKLPLAIGVDKTKISITIPE